MNKTIRKFFGYAFQTWLVILVISAAVITDYRMIEAYSDFQPRVGWWAMLLFLVIPLNVLCVVAVYWGIKCWEMFAEMFTED